MEPARRQGQRAHLRLRPSRATPTASTRLPNSNTCATSAIPFLLQRLNRLEVMLIVYSGQGEEYERKAKDLLFSVANSRKARDGGLAGLQDPALMAKKTHGGESVCAAVAEQSRLQGCRRCLGRDRQGAENTRRQHPRNTPCSKAAPASTRHSSATPARWCAPPRSSPSPTTSDSPNSTIPTSPRSNSSSSHAGRSIPISNWPSSPIR